MSSKRLKQLASITEEQRTTLAIFLTRPTCPLLAYLQSFNSTAHLHDVSPTPASDPLNPSLESTNPTPNRAVQPRLTGELVLIFYNH